MPRLSMRQKTASVCGVVRHAAGSISCGRCVSFILLRSVGFVYGAIGFAV